MSRNYLILVLCTFLAITLTKTYADNPIIKSKFTADPSALVHGNTVYIYAGHDEATTTDTDYRMNNWHVLSSQDMVNWTDHGQKLSVTNFTWANSHAFAGHTVHRNGKFYWYVPMIQKGGGFFSIGVAVADHPLGPFTDALGKALILDSQTPDLHFDIDPAVFIDDDGQAYIYWGNATENGPCKVAKLKPNMIELDGPITTVDIPYFTEAPYVHKRNGTYYMTYASGWPETIVYCTGTSPMGPWTYRGVLNTTVTSATNHQSIIDFKGKSYFVYHNAFPALGGGDYRRGICIDQLNYNTNGTMQQIVRTTQGVTAAHATPEVTPWQSTETIVGAHDPTIIKDERGVYTLLTTNNLLEIRQSTDMVRWTSRGRIFNTLPAWLRNTYAAIENIWAPHIYYRNGRYWVYYSGSSFGSNNSLIGVVSSPTLDHLAPNYAWTDHGEVIRSTTSNNYNAIDPEILTDHTGRIWMSFGSFWSGIKMVEIDPATGKRLASNTTIYNIASRNGGAIEGPASIEHNGQYFMFTSWDACCAGTTSTYRTLVGRSSSATGTYVDKQNRSIMNNYSEELLRSYGRYIGPGGGSPFKDGRRDYYVHHYYNGNQNGAPSLQIREIVWTDDNWPVLTQPFLGRRLSYEAEHAILTSAVISTHNNASNREYVGGMTSTASKVLFYINAFAAGEYTVRIHYAAASNASHLLRINNGTAREVQYPQTPSTGQFPAGQAVSVKVTLKEGGNTLEFAKGTNTAEIDRIDLIRNTFERLEGGAFEDAVGATYMSSGNNSNMATNAWMKYENFDFANGGLKNLTIALASASNAQIRISLDTQSGAINTTLNTTGISNTFALPAAFQEITGIHDLFVTVVSGTCTLDYILFDNKEPNSSCSVTITSSGALSVCQGSTVTLTASSGASYQWFRDGASVSTSQSYVASTSGVYTVRTTNASGCTVTSAPTTVTVSSQNCIDCAGVAGGSAVVDVCSRCIGGSTGRSACTAVGEAEVDACSYDGVTETSNAGFYGVSYLNGTNALGASITFHVLAASSGTATLSFRYANGSANNRPATVTVNGNTAVSSLAFPSTGVFTSWGTVDVLVPLQQGVNQLSLVSNTSEGLANIDQIGYVSTHISKGSCVITHLDENSGATQDATWYFDASNNHLQLNIEGDFSYQIYDLVGHLIKNGQGRDSISVATSLPKGMYIVEFQSKNTRRNLKIFKD